MTAPIDIIIPAFNQLEYCEQCLASIRANTRRTYRLILIDNGSTDGVGAFFDAVPGAVVIHAETNLGFAGGVNLGIEEAGGHVVLLNSDTIVPPGWLDRLERALLMDESIGIVGPVTNCASGIQQIDAPPLSTMDDLAEFSEALSLREHGRLTETYRLVGFCMLIRDIVIRNVGLFDERFGTGNFEDDDYCLRVRRAGYRLCVAHDAFVYHFGSRTFAGMGLTEQKFQKALEGNEQIFLQKWGLDVAAHSEEAVIAGQLNSRARDALERGRLAEALRLQTAAVSAFPRDPRQQNDLGAILWQLGDRVRARACFERALRLNSEDAEARANLEALAKAEEGD